MSPEELATTWCPVPLRWRSVVIGDVFLGSQSRLWLVTQARPVGGEIVVAAMSTGDEFTAGVDPDDVIEVLIPTLEVDAVELTREELGARLVARRTKDEG